MGFCCSSAVGKVGQHGRAEEPARSNTRRQIGETKKHRKKGSKLGPSMWQSHTSHCAPKHFGGITLSKQLSIMTRKRSCNESDQTLQIGLAGQANIAL